MQRVNPAKALSIEQRNARRASSPMVPASEPAAPSTLAKLWLLGIGAWGHRWVSSLGELPVDDHGRLTVAGRLWASQLAGLAEPELLAAVQHLAGRLDWPPSLAEVRKRVLGIPPLDEVAVDIGRMQHRFTRLVWRYLDSWKFGRADGRAADRLLRAAYKVAVEKRMAGEPLPEPPVALVEHSKPQHVPASPEIAQRYIDAMRSQFHIAPDPGPGGVTAEGLPSLELSPAEQVADLRANCIAAGLNPGAMVLQITADAWDAMRSLATHDAPGASCPSFGGFPVRVVNLIPSGKSMQLVRA